MRKVLFISGQGQIVTDIFSGLALDGFSLVSIPAASSEEKKLSHLREAEFLVLHPAVLSGAMMREANSLKLVQLLTVGYDKVDVKAAKELGIPVATNGGANAWAVAEHTIAMLLSLYKRLMECDASVRAGTWRKPVTGFNTFEIAGKTIGIIGAGNIGCKVATLLKAFKADIMYHDRFVIPEIEEKAGARKVSLEELVATADVITLHAPLFESTRGILGPAQFARMKKSVIIINAARAELVDHGELVAALKENRIAGAGVDVYDNEPVEEGNQLLSLNNVILTPHTAGHSFEGWARRSQVAWDNIRKVAAGQAPDFTVSA